MATSSSFPDSGLGRNAVFAELEAARAHDIDWRSGRLGLFVHYAGEDVLEVAKEAHQRFFSENALGAAAFPSLSKFERDIVGWTASLLGSATATGAVTAGGTESIFLAMKCARDWASAVRPGKGVPSIVAPRSAHPAFDKAAHYLGLKVVRVPVASDYRADPQAMAEAVTADTIAIVGSAPCFPYGVIDPIAALGDVAASHQLWFHVDACVGGFIAPFARNLGYPIPDFDFRVPAVTSMSADLHKYGFGAKGASTVLLRDRELMQFLEFDFADWPSGRYRAATFAGTRPAGPIAAAWAVMRYLGRDGYERIVRAIMQTRDRLADGIEAIDGLKIVGDPAVGILAYTAKSLDVDALAEAMIERGWFLSRITQPRGIHLGMLTMAHVDAADDYLRDLRRAADAVRAGRKASETREAHYGGD
jgi:sphinganine-1-phosphate aldolase